MRHHAKQETEPIFATLERYRTELLEHPLLVAARTGQLERTTLLQFAFYQYSDSITWIPMLAQMKSRALRSRRLRAAIEDNIGHEAGIGGTSHVTLAAQLMRSLGVRGLAGFPTDGFGRTAQLWLSDEFVEMPEPALAGWLLTAETLRSRGWSPSSVTGSWRSTCRGRSRGSSTSSCGSRPTSC